MECSNSVPVDKCCLVVQMPTVEEMKREVADITCEMQSVYIDNSIDSSTLSTNITATTPTNTITSSPSTKHHVKYQSDNNITETNLIHSNMNNKMITNSETISDDSKLDSVYLPHNNQHGLHKSLDSRWSTLNIGGDYHNEDDNADNDKVDGTSKVDTFKLNRFGSMLVDRKRLNEHSLSKFISPSVNSSTSSCPREEQVSEEFIINGKRYRQIYQRRVVLERKTTRDVFFLPGNNTDTEIRPSNKNQFEYRSPHYDEQVSSMVPDEESTITSTDSPSDYVISRPGLHLTVLHTKTNAEADEPCLSPAIVVKSLNETRNNYKYPNNSSCLQCSTSPKSNNSLNPNILNQKTDNSKHTVMNVTETIHSHSRARQIVRSLSNSIKRSVSTGIQNTRNFIKSIPGKSKEMESINRFNKLRVSLDNDLCVNTSKQDNFNEGNNHEVNEMKSKQIMGYMYKFGVWDDQQPVLDPRLPIFLNSSIENTSNMNGTVIPTAPEWHHAEVGLENIEKFQGAYVRGRTVACLQRFTQHSLASGKALHRSTYVQQTRLVRQIILLLVFSLIEAVKGRKVKLNVDKMKISKVKKVNMMNGVLILHPKHLLSDLCVFDRSHLSKYEIQPDDTIQPTNSNASGKFIQCSNDRLQLLQSLCPSAAAATILLGKLIHDTHDNDDINQNTLNKSNELHETRVLVTANSWCPVSLRTKDPESQLIFNSNYRDNNNSTTLTKPSTPKHSPSSVTVPEPTIRGGTLDGLLIYIMNLLQTPMPTNHPDYLFPDVIRLTYPTFTTPEKITERLIQMYVAYAPIEPGCQSNDWIDALAAADYLVTIARDIHPEQLTASLILRLNRFARLLMYDNQLLLNDQIQDDNQISGEPHRVLADRLLEKLPILSSKQKLTSYSNKPNSSTNNNVECVWTTRNPVEHKVESNNSLSKEPLVNNNPLTEQSNTKLARMKNNKSANCSNSLTADMKLCNSEPHEDAIRRASEFLEFDARLIAEEITQIEEEKFAEIDFYELLDIEHLEKGEAQTLGKCVNHFNQITIWAKGMLFILAPKIIEKYSTLNSLNHHQIKSTTTTTTTTGKSLFNNFRSCHTSYSSDTSDIQYENKLKHNQYDDTLSDVEMTTNDNSVTSDNLMKSCSFNKTFTLLSSQHKDISMKKIVSVNIMLLKLCEILKLVTNFSSYMKPPNFGEYRRDLETSPLPCLPYLGLIFQQLIHLHIGNPIHLTNSPTTTLSKNDKSKQEVEFVNDQNNSVDQPFKPLKMISTSSTSNSSDIINVWRCWKHYMVLGYFIKRKEGSVENIHHFPHNPQINRVINNFQDQFSDKTLDKAKQQLIILQRSKRNLLTR
ncbi:Rap guanine nucleotide exchange factor 1 [Schistosoma japonicum]|nr:Rap guanine nucleotide exchange factor 1 [Schistosoma japonicum]